MYENNILNLIKEMDSLSSSTLTPKILSSKDLLKIRRNVQRRRSKSACLRCKSQKIKCSDFRPCSKCKSTKSEPGCIESSEAEVKIDICNFSTR